jgi:riboflavin kinase/FMN adenylyltransferase
MIRTMRTARGLEQAGFDERSVVTIGTFDGMHLGHRAILSEVLGKRSSGGGRSVVVTFDPHPRSVVGGSPVALLTTLDERLGLLEGTGIDLALVLEFTYEFSRQSAAEFYERYILRGTGVREVVVGHDHMFGRDREASIATLRDMGRDKGFSVTTVGPVTSEGTRISSSAIRRLLSEAKVSEAAKLLGRPYSLGATVVRGDGRGATIGFPTANLLPLSAEKVLPADGVYLASAVIDGVASHGMVNVGTRPTFGEGGPRLVEAHLFGEQGDLYGRTVRVSFLRHIRGERKFSTVGELTAQLERDRDECLRLIAAAG